jgi:hypothetical protein
VLLTGKTRVRFYVIDDEENGSIQGQTPEKPISVCSIRLKLESEFPRETRIKIREFRTGVMHPIATPPHTSDA